MKNIWEEFLFPYNESSQSIQSWFHKINILLEDKNSKSSTLRTIIFLLSTKRISIFVKYYRKNSIFYDSIFYNSKSLFKSFTILKLGEIRIFEKLLYNYYYILSNRKKMLHNFSPNDKSLFSHYPKYFFSSR